MSRYQKVRAELRKTSFYTDPASTKYHGSYPGGLAEHSTNVRYNLARLTNALDLEWSDPESIDIIALCHDICKVGAYIQNEDGTYTYNPDHPKGHGDLSLSRAMVWIPLTAEEKACIRWHMGAYDVKENWNLYNEAIHRWPNVLWTHTADMMATHIDEV